MLKFIFWINKIIRNIWIKFIFKISEQKWELYFKKHSLSKKLGIKNFLLKFYGSKWNKIWIEDKKQ